ncbi:MAG: DUF1778 domain-containing protein [Phenylobacterium sp.]|uniref:type II toxin -antitoxin system TacA 1-like antitoxin n=1 Tax=Phenylobacterium sp. TaxID=1871053 RepID=UPI00120DE616|nr:DUF1778 domain-containing protein [Phenylobacterium sp.]TAL36828.1 MAG: DUF1778 domain-containing protein [Phenylobacterium sp.]
MPAGQDPIKAIDEPSAERTALRPVDHAAFFGALDQPPAPTDRLTAAFARHRKTVVSR